MKAMQTKLVGFVELAKQQEASDVHLEPECPVTLRIRGQLKTISERISSEALYQLAQEILGSDRWKLFMERRSFDFAKTISGVRTRIHLLQTMRGVGLSIRLLSPVQMTLASCNLHPDLVNLLNEETGLILITGPTGSGKSTTLSAFIQEINLNKSKHIITLESPIEYILHPKKSLIRQREVEHNTPSYYQGLLDAMREDPDVLVVGEMRTPETMQLTLNASETGHLVFATMHSANCVDALNRLTSSFPSEIQDGVRAQLADTLIAVISQKLIYLKDHKMIVPCCEILKSVHSMKNLIRTGEFSKLVNVLQAGAEEGQFSFERYKTWMDRKTSWHRPQNQNYSPTLEDRVPDETAILSPEKLTRKNQQSSHLRDTRNTGLTKKSEAIQKDEIADAFVEIDQEDVEDLDSLVDQLEEKYSKPE